MADIDSNAQGMSRLSMTAAATVPLHRRRLLAASLAAPFLITGKAIAAERLIGWISPESESVTKPFFDAFQAGLTNSLPGGAQPVRIIQRYGANSSEVVRTQVDELQRLGVRLIVSQGYATVAVAAAKPAVPVVFGYSGDPVVAGIVQSMSRPGVNATGVSFMSIELNPKRIDLLRAALPECRRVALLSNSRHAGEENEIKACQEAVGPLGIELTVHRVSTATEVRPAVRQIVDSRAQALVMLPSSLMVQQAPVVAADCVAGKISLISGWANIAHSGAILTYGPNLGEAYKRVALQAVRVLGGAAPASLPVEQPTIFELVINQKTAMALGIGLPATLLAQADEIIE